MALALRTEPWFGCHERIDYVETDRLVVRMKRTPETSWLAEATCVPRQQVLRHLSAAFLNFSAGRAHSTLAFSGSMIDRAPHTASMTSGGRTVTSRSPS